ncbi:MAG: sodium:alanine symporter family protein [Clostridia bacterium]|nr:sodium:alanine symporter family protein [Clostridia bacterium]
MFLTVISALNAVLWGPPLLAAFLGTGVYLSFRTGWFQLTGLPVWLRATLLRPRGRRKTAEKGAISSFGALNAALSACLGTGNIVGVATALCAGGPGTVLWMLLSAVPGMMTCCCETMLGVEYRTRDAKGRYHGGPPEYLTYGLGKPRLAKLYALFLTGAAFGMGNMTQANAVAQGLAGYGVPAWGSALLLLPPLAVLLAGGLQRIAALAERLIPALTVGFAAACLWIIFLHRAALPATLRLIVRAAFTLRAAGGFGLAKAARWGVARGVFSNEAGLGSNALIHAGADCDHPGAQGMWGILEVGIDTVVMCTLTALALLTSGVWQPGTPLTGAALCTAAFASAFGPAGGVLLTGSLCLFAFATLNAWSYYGRRGAQTLAGRRGERWFLLLYPAAAVAGCLLRLEPVWALSDFFNGLMALPNLYALWRLAPEAAALLRDYRRRTGDELP